MQGCCSFCGKAPKSGHAAWCARPKGVSNQMLWKQARRAKGLCVQCGKGAGGKSRCAECDERQAMRRRKVKRESRIVEAPVPGRDFAKGFMDELADINASLAAQRNKVPT